MSETLYLQPPFTFTLHAPRIGGVARASEGLASVKSRITVSQVELKIIRYFSLLHSCNARHNVEGTGTVSVFQCKR